MDGEVIPAVDISEHQGPGAGKIVADAGIRHVIARCADPARIHGFPGTPIGPIDPFYISNMAELADAGVARDTYVFCRPSMHPASVAADRYDLWARLADPEFLWLDFEGNPGLGPRPLAAWILELVRRLEDDHGWRDRLGIYTQRSWWDGDITPDSPEYTPRVDPLADELARLPLWCAGYWFGERTPPTDPGEWTAWVAGVDSMQYVPRAWRPSGWAVWQFTSSGTLVPGHRLDCNLLDPSMRKDRPVPVPEEDDVTLNIPPWGRETSPGRWESYELADGNTLISWGGAEIRSIDDPNQPHPSAAQGSDGWVLNLEAAGYGPGPYSGPTFSPDGFYVIVKHKGAGDAGHFAIPTGRRYTPPAPTVSLNVAEIANAVAPAVSAQIRSGIEVTTGTVVTDIRWTG